MRRVVLFVPSLRGGGAERSAVRLAGGLARHGIETHLVVASAEGPLRREAERCEGVRLIDLEQRHVRGTVAPLRRLLRATPPDGMISYMPHANLVALLSRRLSGHRFPLVLTEHVAPSYLHRHPHRWRDPRVGLLLPLMRWTYGAATAVAAVSRASAAQLAEFLGWQPDRVLAIPNPIVDERLAAIAGSANTRPWPPPSRVRLIAVGRLHAQKDYPTLLEAVLQARRSVPLELRILGEGPERPHIEALISKLGLEDVVTLCGFVEDPVTQMREADVFVSSSRWEGLPTVHVEALCAGLPVVSTDCEGGGAREVLADGSLGRLVPIGDSDGLAAAIVETLQAPRAVDAEAWRRYSVEAAVEAYQVALWGGGELRLGCDRPVPAEPPRPATPLSSSGPCDSKTPRR